MVKVRVIVLLGSRRHAVQWAQDNFDDIKFSAKAPTESVKEKCLFTEVKDPAFLSSIVAPQVPNEPFVFMYSTEPGWPEPLWHLFTTVIFFNKFMHIAYKQAAQVVYFNENGTFVEGKIEEPWQQYKKRCVEKEKDSIVKRRTLVKALQPLPGDCVSMIDAYLPKVKRLRPKKNWTKVHKGILFDS